LAVAENLRNQWVIAVVPTDHATRRPTLKRYLNLSGDSGILGYEFGDDFILVEFKSGATYRYGSVRPGQYHVDRMKARAIAGRGLATYISQNVGDLYEGKE
jgi:hypothetical protein